MKPSTILTATHLLPVVTEAVTEAGHMLRAEFHRPGGPRGRGHHADIDEEIEIMLKSRLLALYPCGWRGEETASVSGDYTACWVVDPHDGTRDFMRGLRGSAISVALLVNWKPVLGVVHAPTAPDDQGDLLAWAEGGILTRNGTPILPAGGWDTPVIALNADAADYAHYNHGALPGVRIRALPSPAYRLALAAAGEVDAALSLTAGLAPWDIAGGHALLIGAGKVLVDGRGRAICYGAEDSFDGCIGGQTELVDAIVAARPGSGTRKGRAPAVPSRRVADPLLLSRAHGTILGQLAGDALGSAVEFQTATAIARRHPDGVRELCDGGTWNLIAGQPTDDSEMALTLARCIVREGEFNAEAVARSYIAWRNSSPFDIGGTTANGIASLAAGRRPQSDSHSNGALMRVSPIGIFAAGDPALAATLARRDAALTHPSEVCQAASAAFAAAIAVGVAGGDVASMWRAAHDNAGKEAGSKPVRSRLEAARTTRPEDFQHHMGWVLTAFHNAFHWLMRGTPLDKAVIATVSCGGDTDTNAAVCGALLGAVHGREAVPLQWQNAILTCRPVPAPGICHPRPRDYWPDDALDLAEALLVAAS